ncbi:HNH endonuclease [Nocardia sp. CNY236]|uniref:HNH endonuclease n=1 Tax=Nocardia sp. CNY236 TaxID=1169152 RepID=UPI000685FE21|nr:HNH endonuclease signature motif containing protein [Nocardia sp. CNY236]
MTLRPCLECGEPSEAARCPDHARTDDRVRDRDHVHWNGARWKRLSRRLRQIQPWCTSCGATDELTVDHIEPVCARPDLAYELGNLQVLCKRCNSRKGTRGIAPARVGSPSPGQAEFALHTVRGRS